MVADLTDSRDRARNLFQQMLWTPRGAHLLQVRVQALNDDLHTAFKRWYPAPSERTTLHLRPCRRKVAPHRNVSAGHRRPELADFVSSARGHPHRALHWVPGRRNPSPSTIDRGSLSPEPATATASSILRILSSVAFAGRKMWRCLAVS